MQPTNLSCYCKAPLAFSTSHEEAAEKMLFCPFFPPSPCLFPHLLPLFCCLRLSSCGMHNREEGRQKSWLGASSCPLLIVPGSLPFQSRMRSNSLSVWLPSVHGDEGTHETHRHRAPGIDSLSLIRKLPSFLPLRSRDSHSRLLRQPW